MYQTLEEKSRLEERIANAASLYNLQSCGLWVRVFAREIDMSMWNWMEEDFCRHLAKRIGELHDY